jgi:hypothetical protein
LINALKLEAFPFFSSNLEGTPSLKEHKTIFSGLNINEMAVSDQNDFPSFFRLWKMTCQISLILEYNNLLLPLPVRLPYATMF